MSQEQLLARLEAAVSRLESLGVGGGAAAGKKSGDEMDDASTAGLMAYMDFEKFQTENVVKFLASFDAFPVLSAQKAAFEKAWANQGAFFKAIALCKKPADQDAIAFLQPSVDCMTVCGNIGRDLKGIELNLAKGLQEAAQFLSWPFSPPTFAHVEGMRDAAQMWLNRALTESKGDDAKATPVRDFVNGLKDTLTKYAALLKEHYKMGPSWNVSGKDISAVGSVASAAPKAAAAPAAAPVAAAASTPAAPVGNPLAGLNQGLNVTAGLKKVTDDMKTKNQKDLPPVEAPKPKVVAKAEPVAAKPPSITKPGDNYYVEWQWNQPKVEINDVKVSSAIYIGNGRNSNIYITGKPKSITLDKGFRVNVYLPEFLASVELVNCDRCNVYITGAGGNTYAIDKSKGCIINYSKEALEKDITIVTSNISECNIQNQKDEDTLTEVAIPEQYEHKISKRPAGQKGTDLMISAAPVTHG